MDKRHWSNIFNKHPKLLTIDADVKHDWVKTSSDERWDPKKSIEALHIFCNKEKEDRCAKAISSLYNKTCNPFTINKTFLRVDTFSFFQDLVVQETGDAKLKMLLNV